jgi:hypothetical protein
LARENVQPCGRLIEEQNRRIVQDRSSQSNPLFLSRAQLVAQAIGVLGDSEQFDDFIGPLLQATLLDAVQLPEVPDDLARCEPLVKSGRRGKEADTHSDLCWLLFDVETGNARMARRRRDNR